MKENYQITPKLSWRLIGDQVLILDSDHNQKAHELNQVASFIFVALSKEISTSDILTTLKHRYPNQNEEIEKDFQGYLEELEELKLIQ